MKKNHPTVDAQSETNARATALVCGLLAKGWVVRPQTPDYHVDYIIEPVIDGELGGTKFCAQQKGHRTIRFSGGRAKENIKAKHLLYYSERERLPVFLLVVGVEAGRCHFLFLQEWLDANITPHALREKAASGKKVAVDVPEANDVRDSAALAAEVTRSFAYMKRKHPGSVADSISHDIQNFSAIDPRWDVSLNVIDGSKQYLMKPKEDMEISLQVTGAAARALAELHDFGKPLTVSGSEVKLTGSPHFEGREVASLSFKPATSLKAELRIWSEGPDGFSFTLPMTMSRGDAGLMLTSELDESPFRVEIKVLKDVLSQATGWGSMRFIWTFEKWRGKRVGALPYFEPARSLIAAITGKCAIRHELTVRGNRATGGTFGAPSNEVPFLYASSVSDHARKMQGISLKTGIAMEFPPPEEIDEKAVASVDFVHAVLLEGGCKQDGSAFSATSELTFDETAGIDRQSMLDGLERDCSGLSFGFIKTNVTVTIHGSEIPLGDLDYRILSPKIVAEELSRSEFLALNKSSVSVKVCGTSKTEIHIKRAGESLDA